MGKTRTSIKKGEVRNPNGRPKGTPNRTTQEMKDWIKVVIDENLDKMSEDFQKLSPATRLTLIEKYAKYIIPTLAQTNVDANVTGDINIKITYDDDLDNKIDSDI